MWLKNAFTGLKRRLTVDYFRAVRQGDASAILRFALRAAVLLFLAMFKWTIPLAIVLILRQLA